jgi:hypothetical protein
MTRQIYRRKPENEAGYEPPIVDEREVVVAVRGRIRFRSKLCGKAGVTRCERYIHDELRTSVEHALKNGVRITKTLKEED